jgi:hypothetical protein
MPERIEVPRTIAADASVIFGVLCDPQGHVQIDSSGMLMSATGEAVAGVGDSFVVHMDREALNDLPLGKYDVTVKIVTFERDREIAWTPTGNFDIGPCMGTGSNRLKAAPLSRRTTTGPPSGTTGRNSACSP